MIELIQFPWSPFCIVQRRILEFSGVRFKITNIPNQDRSLVWNLTKQRYYAVPIIRDGKNVLFEMNDDTQVIAKYLDEQSAARSFSRRVGRRPIRPLAVYRERNRGRRLQTERHLLAGIRAGGGPARLSPAQGAQVRPRLP